MSGDKAALVAVLVGLACFVGGAAYNEKVIP